MENDHSVCCNFSRRYPRAARLLQVLLPTLGIGLLCALMLLVRILFKSGDDCMVHRVLGLYCPGCGGTRMVLALLHGQVWQAFRYNPGCFVVLALGSVVYILETARYTLSGRVSSRLGDFLLLLTAFILVYALVRNFGPFAWMVPTVVG